MGHSSFHLSHPTNGHNEDTLTNSTTVWLKSHDLLRLRFSNMYELPIFHPYTKSMLRSELMFPQIIMATPLVALGMSPHLVHDTLIWLSFPLAAISMFALCLYVFRHRGIAFFGGLCFAFSSYQFNHLIHINLRFVFFFPLAVLFLLRFLEQRLWRHALLWGAMYSLHALSNGNYLLLGTPCFCLLLIAGMYTKRKEMDLRSLSRIVVCGGMVSALVLVAYLPYFRFNALHIIRQEFAPALGVKLSDFLSTFPSNWLWGDLLWHGRHENTLFFGLVPLCLVFFGCASQNRVPGDFRWLKWASVAATFLAAVLALGDEAQIGQWRIPMPYQILHRYVPGYNAVRVASRSGLYYVFFMSLLASWGLFAVTMKLRSKGHVIIVLVVLLSALEFVNAPLDRTRVIQPDANANHLFQWLAAQPHSPILNVPMGSGYEGIQAKYVYAITRHGQPIVGGKTSHQSILSDMLRNLEFGGITREKVYLTVDIAKSVGTRYIVCWQQESPYASLLQEMTRVRSDLTEAQRFGPYRVYEIIGARLILLDELPGAEPAFEFKLTPRRYLGRQAIMMRRRDDLLGFCFSPQTTYRVQAAATNHGPLREGVIWLPPALPKASSWFMAYLNFDSNHTQVAGEELKQFTFIANGKTAVLQR